MFQNTTWGLCSILVIVSLSLSLLPCALPSCHALESFCLRNPAWVWPGETCSIWLCSPPNGISFTTRSINGGGMGLAWSLITSLATGSLMRAPWWKWLKTGKLCLRDSTVWEAPCRILSKCMENIPERVPWPGQKIPSLSAWDALDLNQRQSASRQSCRET